MKNEVFYPTSPDAKLSLPVPADTVSGAPVIVGSIVGVTATKEGQGGNVDGNASVWTEGVYDLLVITNTTLTVGAKVYIITAQSGNPATALTTTDNSAANPLFGYALEAKGSAPATIRVKLAKV